MANVELVKAIKVGNPPIVTSLGELAAGDTVTMKGDGSTVAGALALNNAANTNSTTIQSGAVSSNVTFTLPDAVGSVGQVLKVSTVPDANSNVLTWGADTEGIASLSADGSPQLSADLDVNGNSIVTNIVNGNISILPDGTGSVLLDGDGTEGNGGVTVENGSIDVKNAGTESEMRLYCEGGNSHFVAIKSANHANLSISGDVTLTLPAETGTVSTQSYATGKAVAFSIVFGG
jgi:hypothetical protein